MWQFMGLQGCVDQIESMRVEWKRTVRRATLWHVAVAVSWKGRGGYLDPFGDTVVHFQCSAACRRSAPSDRPDQYTPKPPVEYTYKGWELLHRTAKTRAPTVWGNLNRFQIQLSRGIVRDTYWCICDDSWAWLRQSNIRRTIFRRLCSTLFLILTEVVSCPYVLSSTIQGGFERELQDWSNVDRLALASKSGLGGVLNESIVGAWIVHTPSSTLSMWQRAETLVIQVYDLEVQFQYWSAYSI